MQLNNNNGKYMYVQGREFKNTYDLYTRIFYSNEKKMKEKKNQILFYHFI